MLKVNGIYKKYGNNEVVSDLSFEIGEGEIFALLGDNGAGKSTTLKMIAGIIKPDKGTIKLDLIDSVRDNKKYLKNIGYAPQDIALYGNLTGYDNLTYFASLAGVPKNDLKKRMEEAIDAVSLDEKILAKRVKDCSGGMQRKINLAVAIINKPRLLVMDESFVGMDEGTREKLISSLKKYSGEGMSVLYVGHYLEEAGLFCERALVIKAGKETMSGNIKELLDKVSGGKNGQAGKGI
ncbi:MAG TPA: ABC transporter [Lachnospiraceae bacterium]|jgi:ABC-2 type transport system ATP-binding protein|nr:ABC transporter [Lachnospiraceae bacterium]